MQMNEECLLKYLLNPNELEILTEVLQTFTKESYTEAETIINSKKAVPA